MSKRNKRKEINEKVDNLDPYSIDTNIEVAIEYFQSLKKLHEEKGYRNIRLDWCSGDYWEGDHFKVFATRDETDDEMKDRLIKEENQKKHDQQAKKKKEEAERKLYLKLKKKFKEED